MNNQEFKLWCAQKSVAAQEEGVSSPPLVMGILNITPDSFSDGGCFMGQDQALYQAEAMIKAGADLIDIGGESTRPKAIPLGLDEELERVIPVIGALRQNSDICISIDSYKPEVMEAAALAGAGFINDITALSHSETSFKTAAKLNLPICLMHMRGTPSTMQDNLDYCGGIMENLHAFFTDKIEQCIKNGLQKEQLILDPGFGFGKSVSHNLQIIAQLQTLKLYQLPLMLGLSRKSTLGEIVNKPVHERLIAGTCLSVMALMQGVNILRTHDVDETKQAIAIVEAVKKRGLMA